VSRRSLPLNFQPNDSRLFSHELESVIPPTRLLTLHDVGVSAEGILFQGGQMLPESFAFPANRENWKRRSVLKFYLMNYLLRSRRRFERDGVWVLDDWSGGYFHWLADVLPRLSTVRERLKDLVLLLPQKFKDVEFVQASLKAFAVGGIEYIRSNEVLSCRTLLVPTQTAPSGHYNEELIRQVRDLLVGVFAGEPRASSDDRVYISRSQSPKRRIVNEDDVVDTLRRHGFRIVRTEDYSFGEQVRMATQARYLVSNHGAGLTNMLFMNAGTNVLELRCVDDGINNCYFTLAAALNLRYFYQCCDRANRGDPHMANIRVDSGALRRNLELMLGS
jgi:capsular polysaccharide biosynthesis protein